MNKHFTVKLGSEDEFKKIKDIFKRYFKLVVDCVDNKQLKKDLLEHPRETLLKRDPDMIIPKGIHVKLDTGTRHAKIKFEKKGSSKNHKHKFEINEKELGIQVIEYLTKQKYKDVKTEGEQTIGEIRRFGDEGKHKAIIVELEECSLSDWDITIILPFWDVEKDMLGEIKLSDQDDNIILSTC